MAANAAIIDEMRQNSERHDGGEAQEDRRENLLEQRRDEVSRCELALERS